MCSGGARKLPRSSVRSRKPFAGNNGRMDPGLREGYDRARRMLRRHDPTYYFATRRLPAELRPATHALYGYVRTADEIVDGPRRDPHPEQRRAKLDAWERELTRGVNARHPIVRALADAAARHRLPLGELRVYMRSMRVDCAPVRIGSWDELVAYMDGSAGSVGRIMAALLGIPPRHHAGLGRLGLAFQLANFIRDVGEDRRLDRVYLPAEDRARFGVSEDDLAAPRATPELRALLAHEVERARALFASARPAIAAAPASVRPGVRVAVGLYTRMLNRVEANGYDVLARRAGVRAWHLPGAVRDALG
jgi:phytoene synthase